MDLKKQWSSGLGAVLDMLKKHGQDLDLSLTFSYDIAYLQHFPWTFCYQIHICFDILGYKSLYQ